MTVVTILTRDGSPLRTVFNIHVSRIQKFRVNSLITLSLIICRFVIALARNWWDAASHPTLPRCPWVAVQYSPSVHISRYADAPASCPTNACSVWAELHRFHRQKPRTNPLVLCSSRGKNAARIRLHSAGGLQADNAHFNASLARFAEADLLLKNYLVPLAPPNYSRLCKSWKKHNTQLCLHGKKNA